MNNWELAIAIYLIIGWLIAVACILMPAVRKRGTGTGIGVNLMIMAIWLPIIVHILFEKRQKRGARK